MAKKTAKTNAMRILEREGISYTAREFETDGTLTAAEVARQLHEPTERFFKTLVTTDNHSGYYVFCLPSDAELDLKAAAKAAGVKKIDMLKQKDLFALTGYVHGGCSPVGMKKVFPTYIETSALAFKTIYVSAGKIGMQLEVDPRDLEKAVRAVFKDVARKA